jgi:tether containing UBX domain for GLUT4
MFKSHAMREAEAAALAASLGPVRVRLHFPDATIVQATFESSQPLSAVQQLVTQLSVQALGPALYLYTTPPKTVLKDLTATLYQLKLVPAAHLYVGCDVKKLKGPAAAEAAAGEALGRGVGLSHVVGLSLV